MKSMVINMKGLKDFRYGAVDDTDSDTDPYSKLSNKSTSTSTLDSVEIEDSFPQLQQYKASTSKECYFQDGQRRIDYVFVFTKERSKDLMDANDRQQERDRRDRREKYLENIQAAGLQIEMDVIEAKKTKVRYIKVHAPWELLCACAEDMGLKKPLHQLAQYDLYEECTQTMLSKLRLKKNLMQQEVPNKPMDYYTCKFQKSKLNRFMGGNNPDTFFTTRERQMIVHDILVTTLYGEARNADVGLDKLLDQKVFVAVYPLHDGPDTLTATVLEPKHMNARQILHRHWWQTFYKYQPLDHVREYFGEKIAMYFAWLGFHTTWMFPATIVGFFVLLYALFDMPSDFVANETCDSGLEFKMCPLCDEHIGCNYWHVSRTCSFTRFSHLSDNPGTFVYAVFISFWAMMYVEFWKRKSAKLSRRWDSPDSVQQQERQRPAYVIEATITKDNPVTGMREPWVTPKHTYERVLHNIALFVIMTGVVFIFVLVVIIFRILVSKALFQSDYLHNAAFVLAGVTSALVNLCVIMLMEKIFFLLANSITEGEKHMTESKFQSSLVAKIALFQGFNYCTSMIYVAFVQGKMVGYPGHYLHILGLRSEDCQNGGCFIELGMQLGVIVIGKQFFSVFGSSILPSLQKCLHKANNDDMINKKKAKHLKKRWEEDFELPESDNHTRDYMEHCIQFGFVTIFVSSFPLAPLFCVLYNWLKIRLDARKLVSMTRRPVGERCQGIGPWFNVLNTIAHIAVILNAFLLAFTSDFLPKQMYKFSVSKDQTLSGYLDFTLAWAPEGSTEELCRYRDFRDTNGVHNKFYWELQTARLVFVIFFIHIVFGLCHVIGNWLIPDMTGASEKKMLREQHLSKLALMEDDIIMTIHKRNGNGDDFETEPSVVVTKPNYK